jgi:hypothetical protein
MSARQRKQGNVEWKLSSAWTELLDGTADIGRRRRRVRSVVERGSRVGQVTIDRNAHFGLTDEARLFTYAFVGLVEEG